jgi:hypothetical protein
VEVALVLYAMIAPELTLSALTRPLNSWPWASVTEDASVMFEDVMLIVEALTAWILVKFPYTAPVADVMYRPPYSPLSCLFAPTFISSFG